MPPGEPLFKDIRDSLKAALETMSEAEGYWYDYGPVILGGAAVWGKGNEWAAPLVYLRYLGEAGGDPLEGAERPYRTFTRHDIFEVSVLIKDEDQGDHELKGRRVQMDIHTAMMVDRSRGAAGGTAGRPRTKDLSDLAWEPKGKTLTEPEGGVVRVRYAVRYDHITGDMSDADH